MFIQTLSKPGQKATLLSEVASICCLHRIGLSQEECIYDWDQLGLTGECWESGKQAKREECMLFGAAGETMLISAAEHKVDLSLPLISWKQVPRGLSFLLLVGLQRRDL